MDDYNFDLEDDAEDFDNFDDDFEDSFEGSLEDFEDPDISEEEGDDNRTFWLVAGILGAILILALVCMVIYGLVWLPGQRASRETEAAAIEATNISMQEAADATAEAAAWTPTPTITETPAPVTPTASNTPVVQPTDTPSGPTVTTDPRTATVSALLTQQAGTGITPTPTGLPDSGFADDVGIPGMLALAAALVVVIFLARRLRTSS
jgi:hypothetical protein